MDEVEVETQGIGKKATTTRGREDNDEKKRRPKKGSLKRRLLMFVKRLQLKETSTWKWRWRFLGSSAFKWRLRTGSWHVSLMDDVLFKIVSALEAVFLVATLCFFFLCCGCHF